MPPTRAPKRPRDPGKGPAVDTIEAAILLGVSRPSIYNYLEDGYLDYYTEPKGLSLKYMIYVSSINKFKQNHYQQK